MKDKGKNRNVRRILGAVLAALMLSVCLAVPAAASLRRGDRNETVRTVQQKLKNWGYYTGTVDGIFGPKTEEAVRSFQKKNGLTVDGIVGSRTLAALGMSAAQPSSGSASYSTEINMLARMIAAEGRGEPYLGQVAIGAVIMNRVKHPSFPNSVAGVLYQTGAFSALTDGQYQTTEVPDSCRRAAVEAYNGYDPTYGSVYYYNPAKTSNVFMRSRPVVITIGAHVFCR